MKRGRRAAGGLWGLLLLGMWAAPVAARQQRDTMGLRPAFRLIDRYAAQHMQEQDTPGLALALVDRTGLVTVRTYGYADLERRRPVLPETRFQIGSISKSFTAIALLQLADSGRFDPARPVREYLPWFTPTSRFRPITGHDLLTHTAGLPQDRDDVPSSPAQAYVVRERTVGSAPGTRWSYSNIGYQVLGVLLETLTGQSYPSAIRERILLPLGLTGADAEFTNTSRPGLAVGYQSIHDDRPPRATDPLAPAPWVEYASGDGSLIMTAAELGHYLTMLLNGGQGPGGRILSERGFDRLMRPAARTERGGDWYGYGLLLGEVGGRPVFRHSGGMLGYSAQLLGEPGLGIGAVALMNGPGSPGEVASFALRALGAAMRGDTLPSLPPSAEPYATRSAARYAGSYTAADGSALVFESAGDTVFLATAAGRKALTVYGDDAFLGPLPDFALFPIRFAGDSTGMTEVWYGGDWYAGARYRGPRSFRTPAEWKAYTGHYRIMQPWEPSFRVVLRKGSLWQVQPDGSEEPLTAIGPREFRIGEAGSAERLQFGDIVDGRALTATWSGMKFYRFFTP